MLALKGSAAILDRSEGEALHGIGHRLQVPLREVKVLRGRFQITVTEQDLNGAQIGAGLQQVGRPTVAPMSLKT